MRQRLGDTTRKQIRDGTHIFQEPRTIIAARRADAQPAEVVVEIVAGDVGRERSKIAKPYLLRGDVVDVCNPIDILAGRTQPGEREREEMKYARKMLANARLVPRENSRESLVGLAAFLLEERIDLLRHRKRDNVRREPPCGAYEIGKRSQLASIVQSLICHPTLAKRTRPSDRGKAVQGRSACGDVGKRERVRQIADVCRKTRVVREDKQLRSLFQRADIGRRSATQYRVYRRRKAADCRVDSLPGHDAT